MLHLVARAQPGTLLFRTAEEGRALLERLLAAFPRAAALVCMPDHVHLMTTVAGAEALLHRVMRSYALWRGHHRGEFGPVWATAPEPQAPADPRHARRLQRYIFLNPVRKGLVDDPLAWAWGNYRDRLGLALPARPWGFADPAEVHAWVSSEAPSVLPRGGERSFEALEAGVSSLYRVSVPELVLPAAPCRTLLRVASTVGAYGTAALAEAAAVPRRSVQRWARERARPEDARVALVAGDARFGAIPSGDLYEAPLWQELYPGRR